MEEKVKFSRPVPPFVRYCAATIPTVFDDSLSYYECLCALWKWLQDNLVDVINDNAAITEDLQIKVKELKEFVENYFDNLDVQEEINNKLDAMTEDGTLQEIIGAYLNANAVWGFDNVADMKASTNLIDGSFARTLGYYTINDGGRALYKIRAITNDDIVDDSFIIEIGDSSDQLVAELVYFGEVNIKQLGAKGDGATDDTTKFTLATNKGVNIYVPEGTFMVSSIVLQSNETIKGDGWSKSYIKSIPNNNNVTAIITAIPDAQRVNILDLAVNGNSSNNSNSIDGIYLYRTPSGSDPHSYINNVRCFYCSGNGIKMERQLESRINHCVCNNNNLNGILYVNTSDAVIEDVTCSSNTQNGIRITTGANRIINCKCFYNGFNGTFGYTDMRYSGFYISGANNTISDCHAQENGAHGIELGTSNEISVSGCCVDNNGLYFDSEGNVIPLPEDVDPIYDGIHANHVRRSYIEVCGRNFHLSNGASQRTTLCFENGSECSLNTFVVSSGNQLIKDFEMNDATKCKGSVNGIGVESTVDVGYRFLEASATVGTITNDTEYPITVREENGYIHVKGCIMIENELTTSMNEVGVIKITDTTKYNKEALFLTVQVYPTSIYSNPLGFINARMSTDGSIKIRNRGSLTGIRKIMFDFSYIPVEQQNS